MGEILNKELAFQIFVNAYEHLIMREEKERHKERKKLNLFKNLPKKGLEAFFDFHRIAKKEASEMIKNLSVKKKSDEQEAKGATQYAIASAFVQMYEDRYGEDFIDEIIRFYTKPEVIDFMHDHSIIELQKIQSDDEDPSKRKHRSNGILLIGKLAEKLQTYKQYAKLWEIENDFSRENRNEDIEK